MADSTCAPAVENWTPSASRPSSRRVGEVQAGGEFGAVRVSIRGAQVESSTGRSRRV